MKDKKGIKIFQHISNEIMNECIQCFLCKCTSEIWTHCLLSLPNKKKLSLRKKIRFCYLLPYCCAKMEAKTWPGLRAPLATDELDTDPTA